MLLIVHQVRVIYHTIFTLNTQKDIPSKQCRPRSGTQMDTDASTKINAKVFFQGLAVAQCCHYLEYEKYKCCRKKGVDFSSGSWKKTNKTKHKHSFKVLKRDTFLNNIAKTGCFMEAQKKLFSLVGNWLKIQVSRVQTQARPHNFSGDWSWNNFYSHSSPSVDFRRAVVSYWWKYSLTA